MTIPEIEDKHIQTLLPRLNTKERRDIWGSGHSENHPVDGIRPWDRVEMVLKKFRGKSFDKAFSYYCTLVPKYQQRHFLERFEGMRRYIGRDYYLNSQKVICREKRKPSKPITFKSDDFQTIKVHKVTGHQFDHFEEVWSTETVTYFCKWRKREVTEEKKLKFLHYEYRGAHRYTKIPAWRIYTASADDFEHVITKGWIAYFKSKEDPLFKRFHYEWIKARDKSRRLSEKTQAGKTVFVPYQNGRGNQKSKD